MSVPYSIVIVGASFGGLPVAHGLLKDVLPASGRDYKLTLINPSEEFWWKVGSPRAITRPQSLPLEKALLNFLPTFEKYGDKFAFVKASATNIDPNTKTVSTDTGATVKYDALVLASGTSFESNVWSTSRGTDALKAEVKALHASLPNAQSILVAGGGAAGIETAGELGEEYGGKKEITLLSGGGSLLSRLSNPKPGKNAESFLESLKVKVVHNVRITSISQEGGRSILALSNGETKTVDVYISATGDKPNNGFIPKEWLNEKGYVNTDENTLRVVSVPGVYCIGTVASYSDGSIMDTKMAYKALVESVKLDLASQEPGPRTKGIYKKMKGDVQIVPIGSQRGVGSAFGWTLPSFLVKTVKSKDFMIGNAAKWMEGNA